MTEPTVKLYLGDCQDVMKTLPDGCVDAVVTDPPYNLGIDYGELTNDKRNDYLEWCMKWFAELRRVCRGAISVSVGQANLSEWARIAPPDWWMAWWKPAAMGRCVIGFNNWEPIAVYGKSVKAESDVIRASIVPDASLLGHPCPKPLKWGTKQVQMFSETNSTVLDPFMGSGTTGVACVQLGRSFIGIEIDPTYYAIAEKRISEAQAQPQLPAFRLTSGSSRRASHADVQDELL